MPVQRNGIGFDLHALVEGPPLFIGGVEIPCDVGPEAHSDGDVLLHAACDAVLGGCGLGDIGEQFPDSDPENEGLPGDQMVEEVLDRVEEHGFHVYQMDSIILLERPSLQSHKQEIRLNVADLFSLDPSRVGVKATSMEGFGAVGEGNAIAARVSVMVTEEQ